MHRFKRGGIAPRQVLGGHGFARSPVELFGEVETAGFDVVVHSGEHAVARTSNRLCERRSFEVGCGRPTQHVGPQRSGLRRQRGPVGGLDLCRGAVQQLSQSGSQQDPGVAAGVVVALVAAVQDAGHARLGVGLVDGEGGAEKVVQRFDGARHLLAGRAERAVAEVAVVEGADHSGVFLAGLRLEHELVVAVPVSLQGLGDSAGGGFVGARAGGVALRLREVGALGQRGALRVAVPEEVVRLDLCLLYTSPSPRDRG